MKQKIISFIFLIFISYSLSAQNNRTDSTSIANEEMILANGVKIDSLSQSYLRSPLKASLYSAILPGLGQFYNKKYIKAPIVLAVIGTGIGFIKYYDNRYKRYHKAFLAELSGQPHEFSGVTGMTAKVLANAEDSEKRNKNYAIILTALAYLLNIVDAAVDAHLSIFDKDKDLAIKPVIIEDPNSIVSNQKLGLSFSLTF